MWGKKTVVLCLERSIALFALVSLLTLFGTTARAQVGGGHLTSGGAEESAPAKPAASAPPRNRAAGAPSDRRPASAAVEAPAFVNHAAK